MTWKTEWWISLLENRIKKKRMKRNDDRLRDLWEKIKCNHIRILWVPKEEETETGSEKIFEETTVENFPNMGKEINSQVQEVQRVPYRINPRRNTLKHILIKKKPKIKFKKIY